MFKPPRIPAPFNVVEHTPNGRSYVVAASRTLAGAAALRIAASILLRRSREDGLPSLFTVQSKTPDHATMRRIGDLAWF
jgi:hypothetical protein